jgi:hypothetical protein
VPAPPSASFSGSVQYAPIASCTAAAAAARLDWPLSENHATVIALACETWTGYCNGTAVLRIVSPLRRTHQMYQPPASVAPPPPPNPPPAEVTVLNTELDPCVPEPLAGDPAPPAPTVTVYEVPAVTANGDSKAAPAPVLVHVLRTPPAPPPPPT